MNIRESMEERELELLSPYAAYSGRSKGRDRPEEECDVRTVYQRDRDRILHSKAFRRMKDKTQVFLAPEGDHYRNRLTHTLEVSQIARTIAKALRLNEDLVEAIALGHDLGHTPFGHSGEAALNAVHIFFSVWYRFQVSCSSICLYLYHLYTFLPIWYKFKVFTIIIPHTPQHFQLFDNFVVYF